MPEVAIRIGPKTYTVRCGEGEQDRIAELGRMIAERYARLGTARAPLESHNMLLAALFMADELNEAQAAAEAAAKTARGALAKVEQERERGTGAKAALEAELATLRKAEARTRAEAAGIKAELAQLREAEARQHDLFGASDTDSADEETLAAALEGLAERIEAAALALESAQAATVEGA